MISAGRWNISPRFDRVAARAQDGASCSSHTFDGGLSPRGGISSERGTDVDQIITLGNAISRGGEGLMHWSLDAHAIRSVSGGYH